MQIIISNIAKSDINLRKLQNYIINFLPNNIPIVLAIIEPPLTCTFPNIQNFLSTFFANKNQNTTVLAAPLVGKKSKIIFIHNSLTPISGISLNTVVNHEAGRCFGIQFTQNGQPYELYAIHGLDLINHPESDYERHICEYNIYSQLRSISGKNVLIAGDFNANEDNHAINSKLGLNAAIDHTKSFDYLNLTDGAIKETINQFTNAAAENIKGSFYHHGSKYNKSKWVAIDQIFISRPLANTKPQNICYITQLGQDDLITHLKKRKIGNNKLNYFDHLPISVRL